MSAPRDSTSIELVIATWNLAGRWTPRHRELLESLDCDVLLLTEVAEQTALPTYAGHVTDASMTAGRRWAGIFSRRPITAQPDPHPASAAATMGGVAWCCSVLPWRSANGAPWVGDSLAERTTHAVDGIAARLPRGDVVLGGDWNHALTGRDWSGSRVGRARLMRALEDLGLSAPTADLPSRTDGQATVDHIAVPRSWEVLSAQRVAADGLSDHDAYVVRVHR